MNESAREWSLTRREAVRANQIGMWRADPPPSYQAYTEAMNELTTTIAGWRTVT